MNKLPPEILQDIFLLLHQQDKVECMTVCRHWNQAMEDSVLFDTLCLHNDQQFDDFMSKHQRDLSLYKKIGRLAINTRILESLDINTLLLATSNLRELHFYEGDERHYSSLLKLETFHPWYNTIKAIKERSFDMLTYDILKGGMFSVLRELSVEGIATEITRSFIELLSNTPVLKLLSLTSCRLSLGDLELLHTNVPLLSSFELFDADVDSVTLLPEIRSATFVTKLSMYGVHVSTTLAYINLQKYFSIKYPKITEMAHDISVNEYVNNKRLCAFYIKQIAPHLTTLKIGPTTDPKFVITRLDYSNGRIREIELCLSKGLSEFHELLQSNQSQYIQSLSLKRISVDNSVEYLSLLPVLTELSLECESLEKVIINISRLLVYIGGTLKTLRLLRAKLAFDFKSIQEHPGLKDLTLEHCTIPKRIDYYISKSFPKLRTLVLYGGTWAGSTLYFGGLNLDYLEVRYRLRSIEPYVLLVTTSNNEQRLYTVKAVSDERTRSTTDTILFPAVKSFPLGKSSTFPGRTLVCSSVRTFNFLALKPLAIMQG